MNSISTPRTKANPLIRAVNYPQMKNVLSHFRQKDNKIIQLQSEVGFLREAISFFEVLYPFDSTVGYENGVIVANVESLKRKLALVKLHLEFGDVESARAELCVIPSDWAPDYMKDGAYDRMNPLSWIKHKL